MWLCVSWLCVSCDCVSCDCVSCDYRRLGDFHGKNNSHFKFRIKIFIAHWFRNVACFHIFFARFIFVNWRKYFHGENFPICSMCIMWLCIMWLRRSGHFHDKNNNFRIKIFYRSPVPQCSMYTYILFSHVSFSSLLWTHENILMVKTSRSAVCVSCDCITWLCHFISPHRTPNQNTDQILGRS